MRSGAASGPSREESAREESARAEVAGDWDLRLYQVEAALQGQQLAAVVALAGGAVRALLLLNGGAVLALLSLQGALLGQGRATLDPAALAFALGCFVGALVAACGCAGAAYLAQTLHAEAGPRSERRARRLRRLACLLGAASLAGFSLGAFQALAALVP
jgi:hypothetical protein